jgi:oligopeptide/dipeptide ABC transporter ATP-binding protein
MSATTSERLLVAEDVKKHFEVSTSFLEQLLNRSQTVKAVDGVDLTIHENEIVGLVGESGCGKSTLGRTLSRLYEPTAGTIEFDGNDITTASGKRLKELRKHIQVIFQDPRSSLNPRKTAGQIVAKPIKFHDLEYDGSVEDRVIELFEEVGLQESHLQRYPHELSGGQQQRVGIARALALEPDLIIADEPVTALDLSVQAKIINLLKDLQQRHGLAFLFIAHDLSVIRHVCDKVAVMYLGQIIEKGPTDVIFDNAQHPYTRALLESIPTIKGDEKHRRPIEGDVPSPINPPTGCLFHGRCPEYIDDECDKVQPDLEPVNAYAELDTGSDPAEDGVETRDSRAQADQEHQMACHWIDKDLKRREDQDPYK